MLGNFGGELSKNADVSESKETGKIQEVELSKESLDWYDNFMESDIGEIDTPLETKEQPEPPRLEQSTRDISTPDQASHELSKTEQPELHDPTEAAQGRKEILPRNGGEWTGEPGDSTWKPDRNLEPGDRNGTNPEHKNWGEILDGHDIDGVEYRDGTPVFDEVSKGTVEVDDFTDDRRTNFAQADEKLAEQRGDSPEAVRAWRKENGYTWHECGDCRTMQKVPTEVHGNIPHSGGVSMYKAEHE